MLPFTRTWRLSLLASLAYKESTMNKTKKYIVILWLFALIGLIVSMMLTQLHYQLNSGTIEERSFCNVSDFFDCDSVLVSRYAYIGPVANSEIGILFYTMMILGLSIALVTEKNRQTLSFLFSASFVCSIFGVRSSILLCKFSSSQMI